MKDDEVTYSLFNMSYDAAKIDWLLLDSLGDEEILIEPNGRW